jgi:hypothetical protein
VRFVRLSLEPLEGRELLSAGGLDPTFSTGGLVLAQGNPGYPPVVRRRSA